jgi:hypothetical protein
MPAHQCHLCQKQPRDMFADPIHERKLRAPAAIERIVRLK